MPSAELIIDASRSAHLTIGSSQQTFPDLGAAMSELARHARESGEEITATIRDGDTSRTICFDGSGRLRPQGETTSAPVPQVPPAPQNAPAQPQPEPPASQDPAPYVVRDRFSGPTAEKPPRVPRPRQHSKAKRSAGTVRKPRVRRRGLTVPGFVLALLLVGVIAAYFVPTFIGSPSNQTPQNIEAPGSQNPNGLKAVQNSPNPVPGFGNTPAWQQTVPSGASVTASDRGVLVVDGNNVRVLDPLTGDTRYEGRVDGPIEIAVDTTIAGENALVWRVGDKAFALMDGQKKVMEYSLPPGARISAAGNQVLIKTGNELSTFSTRTLQTLPTPDPGSTPMALDDQTLISAEFDGPLVLTNTNSGLAKKVELEKPGDNLHIIRWVSAGYGKVITLWGEPGASTNSGHRIQVVVSHVDTGRIASTVATTTDNVGEANWVRGQGHELATLGPYLFNMTDGLLVQDGTIDDVKFGEPRGTMTPAVVQGAQALIDDNVAYKTQAKVLAVGKDASFAIVRSNPETVVGYTQK